MSYLTPISTTSPATNVLKAHLLLAAPGAIDIDVLGAAVLALLGENSDTLRAARKSGDGQKLALRGRAISVLLAMSNTPIGAEHFSQAITPFASAAERAALIAIIGHHEAFITLKVRIHADQTSLAPELLFKGVTAISLASEPLGLFWGPTGRLHHGALLQTLADFKAPMELLLAASCKSVGHRGLCTVSFAGARKTLGFGLNLHVQPLDKQAGLKTGLAFARACIKNPATPMGRSFSHDGRTFRISHADGRAQVTLVPIAHVNLRAGQDFSNNNSVKSVA